MGYLQFFTTIITVSFGGNWRPGHLCSSAEQWIQEGYFLLYGMCNKMKSNLSFRCVWDRNKTSKRKNDPVAFRRSDGGEIPTSEPSLLSSLFQPGLPGSGMWFPHSCKDSKWLAGRPISEYSIFKGLCFLSLYSKSKTTIRNWKVVHLYCTYLWKSKPILKSLLSQH